MLELPQTQEDDLDFLSQIRRIVIGALFRYKPLEVYVVKTDNWFDWKWLPFSLGELPPFNPNRVRYQQHYSWSEKRARFLPDCGGEILHKVQATREHRLQRQLSKLSTLTSFVWYSGNTRTNAVGSMLAYFYMPGGEGSYASFKKAAVWEIKRVIGTTKQELLTFEERGRHQEEPASGL